MMAANQSVLLNAELPPELAAQAAREKVRPDMAWLCVRTDLNLEGHYEENYLLAEPDRLIVLAPPTAGRTAVRVVVARDRIDEIRTRQGVGGGFLDALVDGIYVELLAYSNAKADMLRKAAGKLKLWSRGEKPRIGPEDDIDPRRCPACGLPLQFKGDVCRRCINRGAVFGRVLKMMRPYAGRAVIMMLLVLAAISLSLVPQQLVRLLIDRVLAPEQARNAVLAFDVACDWLLGLVAALLGVHLLTAVTQVITGRLASYVGTQITYDMRSRVFGHLTGLSVAYYDRYNVGQLMSRVAGDTEQMKGFVHQLTSGFMSQFIQVLAVGVVLFSLNWKLALITLLPAPLVVLSAMFFWKRVYPRYYRVWDANSKLHGVLNTILSGIRVVKAFGQEGRERNRFGRSAGYVRDSFRGVEYTVAAFNPAIGVLFQLGGILVWYFGGKWVLGKELSLGALMAFLGYLWMFYQPLGQLTQLTNWLTQFLTATQRTFEILDTPSQIVESDQPKPFDTADGSISFENVTFGYDRHEPIIKSVSFTVSAGEHIGVVGKSGSGKTTLINLLARFYEVDEGCIRINGLDLRDIRLDELRRHIGVVLQEPFLFRGTIWSNITYGMTDAAPEQVIAAAKAANAHGFIMRQPLGYDTYVGERGAGLSGGERQRISIARALLYNPRILILDEATSSVDTESEQLIQAALARATRGRTTIAIAHRLSTLKESDRILVVDSGKIIEQGSHEELLALQGTYWRLVKIQTELSREPAVDSLAARSK
jgi:ATP-binding cassette subfamily B protein